MPDKTPLCGAEFVLGAARGVPACDAPATVALVTDQPVGYGLSAVLGPTTQFNACAEHVEAMAAVLTAARGGIKPKRVKL